jgi:hypothetical protein
MRMTKQVQAALRILEAEPPGIELAQAYAAEGRYAEAADSLLAFKSNLYPRASLEDAARLLRSAAAKGSLGFVYAHVGAPERVMEWPESVLKLYFPVAALIPLRSPDYAPVRKTERFKKLMRDARLVDYWRERGRPDLCRPTAGDDFVCD